MALHVRLMEDVAMKLMTVLSTVVASLIIAAPDPCRDDSGADSHHAKQG